MSIAQELAAFNLLANISVQTTFVAEHTMKQSHSAVIKVFDFLGVVQESINVHLLSSPLTRYSAGVIC